MVFFTDRNLGKTFPSILRDAGLSVEAHDTHFDQHTSDEEWLAYVGKRGWYAVTRDRRIRYRPNERQAVIESGVALFILMGRARSDQLAQAFVGTLPRIERFADEHQAPWIAKVYQPSPAEIQRRPGAPGRVELWYPAK